MNIDLTRHIMSDVDYTCGKHMLGKPLHPAIIMASTLFTADLFLPLKDPVNRNRDTSND